MTETLNLPETEILTSLTLDLWLSRSEIVCRAHKTLFNDPDEDLYGLPSFVSLADANRLPDLRTLHLHGQWTAKHLSQVASLLRRTTRLMFTHADNATVQRAIALAPLISSVGLESCETGDACLKLPASCFSIDEDGCQSPLLLTGGSSGLTRTYKNTQIKRDSWNSQEGIARVWLTHCETDIASGWKKVMKPARIALLQGGTITQRSISRLNFLGVAFYSCKLDHCQKGAPLEKNNITEHLTIQGEWRPIGDGQVTEFLANFTSLKKLGLSHVELNQVMIQQINEMDALETLTLEDCKNAVILRQLSNPNLKTIRCDAKDRKYVAHLAKQATIANDEEIDQAWDEFFVLGVEPDADYCCCPTFITTHSE